MATEQPCPFCGRIRTQQWDHCMSNMCSFEPLNPVVEGHTLVMPLAHIEAIGDYMPSVLGQLAAYAIVVARIKKIKQYNLIMNCGPDATQTIAHIHMHIVPRRKNDGLKLPWTGQRRPRVGSAAEVLSEDKDED